MKARKCDRCGSFYENNKIRDGYGCYGGLFAANNIGTVKRFDLCDKCLDEFERFMANEDKNKRCICDDCIHYIDKDTSACVWCGDGGFSNFEPINKEVEND